MTEVDLVNALNSFVSNRVYPDTAELNTPLPFIIYQQVGGLGFRYLGSETTDKKNARIQIAVFCETRLQAMTMIRAIEDVLVLSPFHCDPLGAAVSTYDDQAKVRGAIQDFSFWITT